jgi:hypothetical protein
LIREGGVLMKSEILNLVDEDLIAGEVVIWAGQPNDRLFCRNDWKMVPYSLFLAVFSFYWEYAVIVSGAPVIMLITGAIFVLFALYALVGRFFYKSYLKTNTYYYVTNKRVMTIKNLSYKKIEVKDIYYLKVINRYIDIDGSGDIEFGNIPFRMSVLINTGMDLFNRGRRFVIVPLAFYDLDNADEVSNLINEIRKGNYGEMNKDDKKTN